MKLAALTVCLLGAASALDVSPPQLNVFVKMMRQADGARRVPAYRYGPGSTQGRSLSLHISSSDGEEYESNLNESFRGDSVPSSISRVNTIREGTTAEFSDGDLLPTNTPPNSPKISSRLHTVCKTQARATSTSPAVVHSDSYEEEQYHTGKFVPFSGKNQASSSRSSSSEKVRKRLPEQHSDSVGMNVNSLDFSQSSPDEEDKNETINVPVIATE